MNRLNETGQFPLESFVTVDPDEIRRRLPEFLGYIQRSPEKAGELTRKEAGMMAEILTISALEQGMNVLVDGSLKDAAWHGKSSTLMWGWNPRNIRLCWLIICPVTLSLWPRRQKTISCHCGKAIVD
jgi:hypothetical protein